MAFAARRLSSVLLLVAAATVLCWAYEAAGTAPLSRRQKLGRRFAGAKQKLQRALRLANVRYTLFYKFKMPDLKTRQGSVRCQGVNYCKKQPTFRLSLRKTRILNRTAVRCVVADDNVRHCPEDLKITLASGGGVKVEFRGQTTGEGEGTIEVQSVEKFVDWGKNAPVSENDVQVEGAKTLPAAPPPPTSSSDDSSSSSSSDDSSSSSSDDSADSDDDAGASPASDDESSDSEAA